MKAELVRETWENRITVPLLALGRVVFAERVLLWCGESLTYFFRWPCFLPQHNPHLVHCPMGCSFDRLPLLIAFGLRTYSSCSHAGNKSGTSAVFLSLRVTSFFFSPLLVLPS